MKHRPRSLVSFLTHLLLLAVVPSSAHGLVYSRVDDGDLADRAAAVVEVRVVSVDPAPGVDRAVTDYGVTVERVIAGHLPGSVVTVRVPGGVLADGTEVLVHGMPRFAEGERLLLFLTPWGDGSFAVLHLVQGAFRIAEVAGRPVAYRRFDGATEVAVPGRSLAPEGPRDLGRFRLWLADRARGVERPPGYFVDVPVPPADDVLDARYTLILSTTNGLPFRWRQFDGGGSVVFRAHVSGQPGVPGGGFAEFQAALAAWNAEPATPIDLRYGGTTGATGGLTTPDGVNAILFDDPNGFFDSPYDCSEGGALAAAVPWASSGETHFFRGREHNTITTADVVTNRGAGCLFGSDRGAEEVFAHEVGHTLGLSHSCGDARSGPCTTAIRRGALMRAFVHADGRGAQLNSDDRAGIAALYDLVPEPPSSPRLLSVVALGPETVRLRWIDRSDDESRFEIERRVAGGDFAQIATVGADVVEYVDAGASSGLTFDYRLRAANDGGVSGYSIEMTVTTPGEPPPTGLTASAVSASEIRLTWVDNATGEDGYEVEGRPGGPGGGGGFAQLATLPAGSERATIGGLAAGTSYTFRVRATVGDGSSSYSESATATTFPGEPEECVAGDTAMCLNGERFRVEVSWTDFEGGSGAGRVVEHGSDDSGLFWFFEPENWEMLVKVIDGCGFNGHHWVFVAATTNVGYTLRVTDSLTGKVAEYVNPLGTTSPAITDTGAFDDCF